MSCGRCLRGEFGVDKGLSLLRGEVGSGALLGGEGFLKVLAVFQYFATSRYLYP